MSLTINGAVTIHKVDSRSRTTVRDDSGIAREELRVRGQTMQATNQAATWAQAQEIERILGEMSRNYWYRVVYVSDDQIGRDTGLYELVEASADVNRDSAINGLIDVAVTLRRIGGGTPHGSNLYRVANILPDLKTNSYSLTSTPIYALPVGAIPIDQTVTYTYTNKDGAQPTLQTSSSASFVLSGADYNKGECKIWDTKGDATEANWVRVYSPDHTFADPGHVVVDNGLIRVKGLTSGNMGVHLWDCWDGSAWTALTSATTGDRTTVGATVADAYAGVRIDELSAYRVKVTFQGSRSTVPQLYTKAITLDRGHFLALVELSSTTSTTLQIGLTAGRFNITRDYAFDDSFDTGDIALVETTDNWVAAVPGTLASVAVIGLGAVRTTTPEWFKLGGGGLLFQATSATSLIVYLGGIRTSTTDFWGQAEAGGLLGTATTASGVTGADPSAGTNAVQLDALNEGVELSQLANPVAGSQVCVWARIKNMGVNAGDTVTIDIWNNTTGTSVVSAAFTHAALGSSGTWKAIGVIWSAWNGTDRIWLRVRRTVAGTADITYVDKGYRLTVGGGGGPYIKQIGNAAVTETETWEVVGQVVL